MAPPDFAPHLQGVTRESRQGDVWKGSQGTVLVYHLHVFIAFLLTHLPPKNPIHNFRSFQLTRFLSYQIAHANGCTTEYLRHHGWRVTIDMPQREFSRVNYPSLHAPPPIFLTCFINCPWVSFFLQAPLWLTWISLIAQGALSQAPFSTPGAPAGGRTVADQKYLQHCVLAKLNLMHATHPDILNDGAIPMFPAKPPT